MPPKKKRGGKAGTAAGDSRAGGELESLIEEKVVTKKKKGKEADDEWQVSTPAREDWSGGVLGLSARTSRSSSVLSRGKAIDLASPTPVRSPARSISNMHGEPGEGGGWMPPAPTQGGGFPGGWGGAAPSEAGAWPSIMGGRSTIAGYEEEGIAMPLPQNPPPQMPTAITFPVPSRTGPPPMPSPRPTGKSSNRGSPASESGRSGQDHSAHATPQKITYLPMSYSGGQKSSIRNMPLGVTPASLLAAQEAGGSGGGPFLNPLPPSTPGPSNHQRSSGNRTSVASSVQMPSPIQMPHPQPSRQSMQQSLSAHIEQDEDGDDQRAPRASTVPLPSLHHGTPSVLRRTSNLPPPRMPVPSMLDPTKPHSKAYLLALADSGLTIESGPLVTHNMRILESGGLALKGAERAMFGSHRHASQRFFWTLPPEHSENVNGLLNWIVAMSWGLGDLGLRKFLSWKDRGALFVNADFRPWSSPEEPAFDWMSFSDAQKTRDQTLQESMASYDPATTVLVFAFLVSESGSSLGIWRRKVSIPVSLQLHYANQINRIKKEIENSRPPVVKIEEDLQPPAPISLYAPVRSVTDPVPFTPPKPRKRRRWWQFWRKKRKTKVYSSR